MPRPTRRGPERREREALKLETMTDHELVQCAYFGGVIKGREFVFRSTMEQRLEAQRTLRERQRQPHG
jgi:hypothetical protein